jgi:hypothetical protein
MIGQQKKLVAFLSSASLLFAITATPSRTFADDIRAFEFTGFKTLTGALLDGFFMSGFSTTGEYVASAKVIVENRSSGVRAVQCQLGLGTTSIIDYANVILAAGESATLSMLRDKNGSNNLSPRVTCYVYTPDTDGVVAGYVRLVQHSGAVQ